MPRPIHFEIHAQDPDRARTFYQTAFGWSFDRWGEQEYWVIKTGDSGEPGIDGGLLKRQGESPVDGQAVNAYVCTVGVLDLESTTKTVLGAGGSIALPRMPIPGVGWLAYFKDPEGNIFGTMQSDPEAK